MTLAWAVALLLPGFVAWALIAILRRSRWAARLADQPNERSLHSAPTPRVGGIGIMAGALPVAAIFSTEPIGIFLACATALALVSLADDVQGLAIEVRLPAHFAAAIVAVLAAGAPEGIGPLHAALAIVALVWMTNLFNFMDGTDGLAGGMAAIGFAALAFAAFLADSMPLALVAAALASASAGFLWHNFPTARAFMGDAGSIPLGFLAGALGFLGILQGIWATWFPLLVFSPFIVDATLTLARRMVRGERFWRAHRGHYYQRLVLAGWSQRRLALHAYVLMLAVALSALAARAAGPEAQLGILLGWTAAYPLLLIAIERRARRAINAQ